MTCSASPIVKVWVGSVKYQLARREEPTAAVSAGRSPPIVATTTTSAR